jgi:hypothetical protein
MWEHASATCSIRFDGIAFFRFQLWNHVSAVWTRLLFACLKRDTVIPQRIFQEEIVRRFVVINRVGSAVPAPLQTRFFRSSFSLSTTTDDGFV